jgi:hypothetical protein
MERVPDGQYKGRPKAIENDAGGTSYAQLGLSKNSGTKQVVIMFEITKGPCKGEVLPWFGYFTMDSKARTVESLRLCGFTGQNILDVETQKLDGEVVLVVENQEYDGKIRSRVAWVNDPDYVPQVNPQKMGDGDKSALLDDLKDVLT